MNGSLVLCTYDVGPLPIEVLSSPSRAKELHLSYTEIQPHLIEVHDVALTLTGQVPSLRKEGHVATPFGVLHKRTMCPAAVLFRKGSKHGEVHVQ